ncbi:hypothetical protein MWU53_07750 [Aliiroseovarius sp. S1123]|jgi:hypothetical protein|uniref:hypothetical protein n=1 Tax=unclassified Aliiroseovarius TaxID=2623558 RepID=UPI001FF2FE96|nr:hypothetical protein [Aliiroseovarius sp. S1123]MCK0170947.1 hypothetical protein [Aliiroseovarius sp. S1123]
MATVCVGIDNPGVLNVEHISLEALSERPDVWFEDASNYDKLLGYIWVEGEIGETILVVEADPYTAFDEIEFEGKVYSCSVDMNTVGNALTSAQLSFGKTSPKAREICLRYYLEFDAFPSPDRASRGGKFLWGGGGHPSKRRLPEEFISVWRRAMSESL